MGGVLQQSSMVPLLADDQDGLKSAQNRYIMKLRPGATLEDARRVCQELAGNIAVPRFKGKCRTPLPEVSDRAAETQCHVALCLPGAPGSQ